MPKPPSDLEIAQSCRLRSIAEVAADLGLLPEEIVLHGPHKAKVRLAALKRLEGRPNGRYVEVTAITPTPLGEGKTTTTIGLSQALARLGHKVATTVRQPSMGPTFGIKGGAAGGGYAQVVPMEDFNLHLTGDIHAVSAAHNLCAAALDARILHEARQGDEALFEGLFPRGRDGTRRIAPSLARRRERLGLAGTGLDDLTSVDRRRLCRLDIDPGRIVWKRVVDVNDRLLREIEIGLGPEESGLARRDGFDIAVASEVMAVLALADDLPDLRARLGRMAVAWDRAGGLVTAEDLGVAGAMAVLLRDALEPNLLQTLEGTPAFVHAGPFANIAHGQSSVVADRLALKLADVVVTESGFGADIGMEKFLDIKCRASGLRPDAAVLVATVRALKMHGGGPEVVAGRPLPRAYLDEDLDLLRKGLPNLVRHVENAGTLGVPVVVAINAFESDTPAETVLVHEAALAAGAREAVVANHWAEDGAGAVELAEAVLRACQSGSEPRFLYRDEDSLRAKIETVCRRIYRAGSVEYSDLALRNLEDLERLGHGRLPVCLAKTHLSFSTDPSAKGAPEGFPVRVREVRASLGAGFLHVLLGDVRTMPGLPTRPAFLDIDLDPATGKVVGLF